MTLGATSTPPRSTGTTDLLHDAKYLVSVPAGQFLWGITRGKMPTVRFLEKLRLTLILQRGQATAARNMTLVMCALC